MWVALKDSLSIPCYSTLLPWEVTLPAGERTGLGSGSPKDIGEIINTIITASQQYKTIIPSFPQQPDHVVCHLVFKEEANELKLNPSDRKDMENLYEFAISPAKYLFMGLQPYETLIFGHTHLPFIEKEHKIANTGAWVDEFGKELQNSYIEIINGEMELKFFK